jgi:hypothetical protein
VSGGVGGVRREGVWRSQPGSLAVWPAEAVVALGRRERSRAVGWTCCQAFFGCVSRCIALYSVALLEACRDVTPAASHRQLWIRLTPNREII